MPSSVDCITTTSESEFSVHTRMGADIFAEIESLARTYERPALRKLFAAFPADTKVA